MKIQRIKGILAQNFFNIKHSLEDVFDTFFFPVMDMIMFGLTATYIAGVGKTGGNIVAFLLSGLILWNIVWRAQQDMSMAFLRNVWNRNILNLFSSPLLPSEFILGTMIVGLIKIIFTLAIVTLLSSALYSFSIFSVGLSLVPFFVNLILFAWVLGIFITGFIIRYGMRIQSFAWSMIALFNPLSAVFYPVSALPHFLQKISWLLPTAHIFEGTRSVLTNQQIPVEHILWALGLNIVYLFLVSLFFNRMFEKARENGKLAKIET